ncbi:MAG: methylated-DNA--[protein]-cysteine S-methyltransferase [Chloroflexi bacterium]|nr:MAG: methylated-DNA--[protein]-cysteine S-methyltransferase [Chloroflexota bacterium]
MPTKPHLYSTTHQTPVGDLTLIASDQGLRAILWPKESARRAGIANRPRRGPDHRILKQTAAQLDEYFAGTRRSFDIPLDLEGTRFQVAAWRALASIPFGGTTSYGQQAAALGIPTAARALGAANRANPVCIVLPCHRVIGADGSLTGFAGGLPTKQWLLDHEARVLMATFVATPQWERRERIQSRLPMPVA